MKNLLGAISMAMPLVWAAASFGQSWNLTGDWDGVSNPNGPWSYGYFQGTSFNSFGPGSGGGYGSGFLVISQHASNQPASYGVDPGQVSLDADGGTPDVRFTAPTTGVYELHLAIGGTTVSEGGGFGNADAHNAGLLLNGSPLAGSYNSGTNIYSWNLNEPLNAGDILDAYVGAGYGGGNTQTIFTISVPEPASLGLIGLCTAAVGRKRK